MGHSFTNLLYHLVFSTKERRGCLDPAFRAALLAQMGELIRQEGGILLESNAMPDHVHLLVKLHQDCKVSDTLRVLKAKSSRWMHKEHPEVEGFAWQTGYGAFTVSCSQVEHVRLYIRNQEEHHKGRTYQDEFRSFLRLHGIDFTEEELWD